MNEIEREPTDETLEARADRLENNLVETAEELGDRVSDAKEKVESVTDGVKKPLPVVAMVSAGVALGGAAWLLASRARRRREETLWRIGSKGYAFQVTRPTVASHSTVLPMIGKAALGLALGAATSFGRMWIESKLEKMFANEKPEEEEPIVH